MHQARSQATGRKPGLGIGAALGAQVRPRSCGPRTESNSTLKPQVTARDAGIPVRTTHCSSRSLVSASANGARRESTTAHTIAWSPPILMGDDVPHPDDAVEVWHFSCRRRVRPTQAVQSLAQDLQLVLHSRLHQETRSKLCDAGAFDEGLSCYTRLMRIPEMRSRRRQHRQPPPARELSHGSTGFG